MSRLKTTLEQLDGWLHLGICDCRPCKPRAEAVLHDARRAHELEAEVTVMYLQLTAEDHIKLLNARDELEARLEKAEYALRLADNALAVSSSTAALDFKQALFYYEDAEPKCTRCQGHGKIVENFCTDYEAASRRECPCYVKCYACYGTGKRKETKMDFQKALTELKSGAKISREGWNGKEMWLALQKGYPEGIGINKNTAAATGLSVGTICKFLPYIMMKTAQREFVPWLASQTDILADDWGVVK